MVASSNNVSPGFEAIRPLVYSAFSAFRNGDIESGERCRDKVRELAMASNHPEDLGFLEYIDFKRYFFAREYNKALECTYRMEKFFRETQCNRRIYIALSERSQTLFRMSRFEETIAVYHQVLDILDDTIEDFNVASLYSNLGEAYIYTCQFNLALDYCQRALKIREKQEDRPHQASTYYKIAVIYMELYDYTKSVDYGNKALELNDNDRDNERYPNILNLLGTVHSHLKEFDKALGYYTESLAIREQQSDIERIAVTYFGMGNMYRAMEDFGKSLECHEKALGLRRKAGNTEFIVSSLVGTSETLMAMGHFDKAIPLLEEAEQGGASRPNILCNIYKCLAQAHENIGDSQSALRYIKMNFVASRNLWETEKSIHLAEMKVRFESDRKEQELRLIREKNRELEEKNEMIALQNKQLEKTLSDLRKSERSLTYIRREISSHEGYNRLIGESEAIRNIRTLMQKVAATEDTSVLITGESGTGKELVARGIHELSTRKKNFFFAINSSAISGTLFESELFGHEKGAFTGADTSKAGWFEVANGGTLFLDEIGNMPLDQQIKMLRALEERNIVRVGARREIAINVRVISATNMNLQELIETRAFREDLFHRLAVFVIHIPPLRDRQPDITVLTEYFVHQFNQRLNKTIRRIDPGVHKRLANHPFPGNVRELRNMVERAMILCDSPCLMAGHFNLPEETTRKTEPTDTVCGSLGDMEKNMLVKALLKTGFNQARAAKILGISAKAVERRVAKFAIRKEDYLREKC